MFCGRSAKDRPHLTKIMKTKLIVAMLLMAVSAWAQNRNPLSLQSTDDQIRVNQQAVKADPGNVSAINRLAYSYIQKVRATADQSYAVMAEKLLRHAIELDSENYDSLVYLALVQMGQHRFVEAKQTARTAVSANPSQALAYGVLGDAEYELGEYTECAEAYQKMIDLRPSTASYCRVAYYRRLIGDIDSANELLRKAIELTDIPDTENRAWCLFQLGNNAFLSGKIQDAEEFYSSALKTFPNYYNALAGMGRVKAAQGKLPEAASYYERAIAIVPMPDFVASLGDLYTLMNRSDEAKKQYALVEYIGLISQINKEIYNRQLALFYADHDRNLPQALELATAEIDFRKDVYGYDAVAWCLYKNGKVQEAEAATEKALAMNTQDPLLFYHAGMIYAAGAIRRSPESGWKPRCH